MFCTRCQKISCGKNCECAKSIDIKEDIDFDNFEEDDINDHSEDDDIIEGTI